MSLLQSWAVALELPLLEEEELISQEEMRDVYSNIDRLGSGRVVKETPSIKEKPEDEDVENLPQGRPLEIHNGPGPKVPYAHGR